jgi:hypothetical protein
LFSPYIIAGIGFFYYNPQAKLNNIWVDLRPLHTEGQGFPGHGTYRPTSWCIPLGAGIMYDAGDLLTCRVEMIYRVTGTDYLDDVSNNYIDPALYKTYLPALQAAMAEQLAYQRSTIVPVAPMAGSSRGNPRNNDAYITCSFKVALVLNRRLYNKHR